MATLQDIADHLRLHKSTVSQVLNRDDPRYNADTRRRVHDAARRLGYRPNAVARSIFFKKTYSIGVVGEDAFHSSAGIERLNVFSRELNGLGYRMFLVTME